MAGEPLNAHSNVEKRNEQKSTGDCYFTANISRYLQTDINFNIQ